MKKYAMIVFAGLVLAACKKKPGDELPPTTVAPEGKSARLTLNITSPANIGTYASSEGNDSGTEIESKVNSVDVFLYNDDGVFSSAGHKRFTGAEATLTAKSVDTKTGKKLIFVGINFPEALANALKDNYGLMRSAYAANMANLVTSTGLMMFNQKSEVLDIKEGSHADNKITIAVTRLVVKAGILKGNNLSLNVQDGVLSNLEFTVGQRNKQMIIGPLNNFMDANWKTISPANTTEYNAAFTGVVNTEYKTVNNNGTANDALNIVYTPENTSEESLPTQVSYIQVRAKFTPNSVPDGSLPADGTFYVVFGQMTSSGAYIHQKYFATKDAADIEAADPKYKNGNNQKSAVLKYDKGLCYYRLYLNEDKFAGGNVADIFRNTFFKAQITKFKALGTPIEGQIPGTEGTPTNPGGGVTPTNPVDPTQPIKPGNVDANIEATITITPWRLINSEHEIG